MRKFNLLVVVLSLVLGVVAIEMTLRVLDISYPEFNQLDTKYGWAPRPGVSGLYASEGRTRIAINRDGFRDIEHSVGKVPGVFRIAVLGDSFTEGREVALDQTFWKVMESELSTCELPDAARVEVLGFGVNGYGAAQELMVLRDKVWKYDPDAVLLAFFTGNDVVNNAPELDRHPDRSYYLLEGSSLVFDDSRQRSAEFERRKYWSDIKHGVYNELRSMQVLRQAYLRLRSAYKYRDTPLLEQLNAGLQTDLYKAPVGAWVQAWKVSEALVRQIALETEEGGADFWLATLSNPIQVYPDEDLRRAFAKQLGVSDLLYPDRRLAAFATTNGLRVVSLVKPLRAAAAVTDHGLHGSSRFAGGHWNAAGHRAAGELLAQAICKHYQK